MNPSSIQQSSWRQEHLAAAATLAYLGVAPPARNQSLPPLRPSAIKFLFPNSRPTPFFPGFRNSFPMKLFEVLDNNQHYDILRWVPNGKAFIILDKARFADEILPKYFKKAQYASFARKLTRWQFSRLSKGPLAGAYYNKLFRRDMKKLCALMTCDGMASDVGMPRQVPVETAGQLNSPPILEKNKNLQTESQTESPQYNPVNLITASASPLVARSRVKMPTYIPPSVAHQRLMARTESTRSRIVQLQREQQWHRNNFLRIATLKAQLQEQFSNPGNVINDHSQTASLIIAEAQKVLQKSYILERNHNPSANSFRVQGSLNPRLVMNKIRSQHQELMLQNRNQGKLQFNVVTSRSLQSNLDPNCPRASAA